MTAARFAFDTQPDTRWAATGYGPRWNGWDTPTVDRPTLIAILAHVIAHSDSRYQAFAVHPDGAAVLADDEGNTDTLRPDPAGDYDLGQLGWTLLSQDRL